MTLEDAYHAILAKTIEQKTNNFIDKVEALGYKGFNKERAYKAFLEKELKKCGRWSRLKVIFSKLKRRCA